MSRLCISRLPVVVFSTATRSPLLSIFFHGSGEAANVFHPQPAASHVEVLKPFSEGPHVDIEDLDLHVRVVFLEHKGAFDRVHTACVRAVTAAFSGGSGSHTLNESNGFRGFPVSGSHQFSLCGTTRVDEPFKFNTGEDIFKPGISIFVHLGGIVHIKPRGHHDGSDILDDLFIGHVKINTLLITGIFTLGAHHRVVPQTLIDIDDVGGGNRLRKGGVNGPA